jgi:hypothetical protein
VIQTQLDLLAPIEELRVQVAALHQGHGVMAEFAKTEPKYTLWSF